MGKVVGEFLGFKVIVDELVPDGRITLVPGRDLSAEMDKVYRDMFVFGTGVMDSSGRHVPLRDLDCGRWKG